MQKDHRPLWLAMIDAIVERDLSAMTVLDFGCNQGGFLRLLHERHPFRRGVGIDSVEEATARARAGAGGLPLDFRVGSSLAGWEGTFDLAFSHEVLYLLPDLGRHAAEMHRALGPGGAYYATIGGHLENPLWPRWREILRDQVTIPPCDYSLEEVARAFQGAGFEVSARWLRPVGFVRYEPGGEGGYFPTLASKLDYFDRVKVLFRFIRG